MSSTFIVDREGKLLPAHIVLDERQREIGWMPIESGGPVTIEFLRMQLRYAKATDQWILGTCAAAEHGPPGAIRAQSTIWHDSAARFGNDLYAINEFDCMPSPNSSRFGSSLCYATDHYLAGTRITLSTFLSDINTGNDGARLARVASMIAGSSALAAFLPQAIPFVTAAVLGLKVVGTIADALTRNTTIAQHHVLLGARRARLQAGRLVCFPEGVHPEPNKLRLSDIDVLTHDGNTFAESYFVLGVSGELSVKCGHFRAEARCARLLETVLHGEDDRDDRAQARFDQLTLQVTELIEAYKALDQKRRA